MNHIEIIDLPFGRTKPMIKPRTSALHSWDVGQIPEHLVSTAYAQLDSTGLRYLSFLWDISIPPPPLFQPLTLQTTSTYTWGVDPLPDRMTWQCSCHCIACLSVQICLAQRWLNVETWEGYVVLGEWWLTPDVIAIFSGQNSYRTPRRAAFPWT